MHAEASIEHCLAFDLIGIATTIHVGTDGQDEWLDFGPLRFTSIECSGATTSDNRRVFLREWIAVDVVECVARAPRGLAQHLRSGVGAGFQAFLETRHSRGMGSGTAMQCIEVFTPNPLRVFLFERFRSCLCFCNGRRSYASLRAGRRFRGWS